MACGNWHLLMCSSLSTIRIMAIPGRLVTCREQITNAQQSRLLLQRWITWRDFCTAAWCMSKRSSLRCNFTWKKIAFACITYTLNIIHDHRVITHKHPSITHSKGLLFAIWFTFVHSELYILSSHVQHVQNQKWTLMTVILIIVRCRVSPKVSGGDWRICTLRGRDSRVGEVLGGQTAVMRSCSDRHVRGYMRAFLYHVCVTPPPAVT